MGGRWLDRFCREHRATIHATCQLQNTNRNSFIYPFVNMLILDSHSVSSCNISSEGHPAGHAGIKYRDLVFVKARSFPIAKRQLAMHSCRETLGGGRFCILLRESECHRYTLCYQVESVN